MRNRSSFAVVWYLWLFEAISVCGGIIVAFVLQYFWAMDACVLCWIDRLIWVLYAAVLFRAWFLETQGQSSRRWVASQCVIRYLLILLAIFHLALISGIYTSDFCVVPELLALHGGVWAWVGNLNLRACAQEPALMGLVHLPVCLLLVYLYWELSYVARSMQDDKRS